MNLASWAINAARKSRKKPIVPGSSGFILRETASNLDTTKDANANIHLLLESSNQYLNEIIDTINNGASYEDLEVLIQQSHPGPDSPLHDSCGSSSSMAKSDHDSVDASTKPELLLNQSEKVARSLEHPVSAPLSHDSSIDAPVPIWNEASSIYPPSLAKDLLPITSAEPVRKLETPLTRNLSLNDGINIKIELVSHDNILDHEGKDDLLCSNSPDVSMTDTVNKVHISHENMGKASDDRRFAPEPHEVPFVIVDEHILPSSTHAANNAETAISDLRTLSPVKLVDGHVAPHTSPNVDLPFIPMSETIYLGNHVATKSQQRVEDDKVIEAGGEMDDSFQAISTAIRKSFVGKSSLGHYPGPLSLHIDLQKETETLKPSIPEWRQSKINMPDRTCSLGVSRSANTLVKLEHEAERVMSPPLTKVPKPRSKSWQKPRYTAPVFVLLPKKESIPLDAVHADKLKRIEPQQEENHTTTFREDDRNGLRNSQNSPQPERKPSMSEVPSISSNRWRTPVILQHPTPTLFSSGTCPKVPSLPRRCARSPTRSPKVLTNKSEMLRHPSSRFPSRTTTAGSPVRRVPTVRPLSMKRSPLKNKTFGSISSSLDSSRSPTMYDHKADCSSVRGSPTNFLIHEVEELQKGQLHQSPRTTHPASPIAQKNGGTVSTERIFLKNRFLTTALLPDSSRRVRKMECPEAAHAVIERPARELIVKPLNKGLVSAGLRDLKASVTAEFSTDPRIAPVRDSKKKLIHIGSKSATKRVFSPNQREKSKPVKLHISATKPTSLPSTSIQAIPRKRALGNAVPLPDAARRVVRKETTRHVQLEENALQDTRARPRTQNLRIDPDPATTPPNNLPDIPSDDDVLRTTKYIKKWAETPEILRVMKEQELINPTSVLGECPDFDMNEIFRSVKSKSKRPPRVNP